MKNLLITLIFLIVLQSCKSQENDIIKIVVQPTLELNTTNSFKILFRGLTSKDSIDIQEVKDLVLNDNPSISEVNINGEDYLEYYTYIEPTKTGSIKLPIIEVILNGEKITSTLSTIEVVKKINKISSNDILLKLNSDRKKYSINDTIVINLYEYSKFYTVKKSIIKKNSLSNSIPNIKGEQGKIVIELESDLYKISGIENLESYVENNFKVVTFDWDPFRSTSMVEKINGENYIKTFLFSVELIAKSKGNYTISPSEFIYRVYRSETNYFDSFVPNERGTYNVNDTADTINIKSEELNFNVK